MTRESDTGDDTGVPPDFYRRNLSLALGGKRGQAALRELKAALLALPEKKLIEGAICTLERAEEENDDPPWRGEAHLKEEHGEGVCVIGAYAWYQRVKGGMEPLEAFRSLPTMGDDEYVMYDTAVFGTEVGLTLTLAWQLAYLNDDEWGEMTPEARYTRFLEWIERLTT